LPLALSSIGMGTFLAANQGLFRWPIFVLASVTTVLLQVLSNFANDYGDSQNGADSDQRVGPARSVQSGAISARGMKAAIKITAALALITGLTLIWISFSDNLKSMLLFLSLGLFAIWAAYRYTAGSNPYGYAGWGDFFVLVFFGFVGVFGTFFLYTKSFDLSVLLPALSCGAFSIAVLNINNIRDIDSDRLSGKFSIPVRLGRKYATLYHWFLLFLGFASAVLFTILNFQSPYQWSFLMVTPLLLKSGLGVAKRTSPEELDPLLKQMAITTLLFVLIFGLGLLFS